MVLGLLALTLLIGSVCCLFYKKSILSFAGSISAMVLTCLTGYHWREMLIDSGKDTALLGFYRYPAAVIILAIFATATSVTMILSIISIVQQNKSKNT